MKLRYKNISIPRQITCNNAVPFVNVFSVCTGDDKEIIKPSLPFYDMAYLLKCRVGGMYSYRVYGILRTSLFS